MLGYRNTPAGPRMLQPWITYPAGSWPPLPSGSVGLAATRIAGPTGPAGPVARPIQASLALVLPGRNRADTISPPKRY